MEGLLSSIKDILGDTAKPTPIQALTLKNLFHRTTRDEQLGQYRISTTTNPGIWRQYLLASETGSGKSIAYLLPMLQYLKQTELDQEQKRNPKPPLPSHLLHPRGLVLAPTHELSRQLSKFAKSLLHNIKLRVLCTSQANAGSSTGRSGRKETARKLKEDLSALIYGTDGAITNADDGEFEIRPRKSRRSADIVVGTPMKALEMVRGWGWDKVEERNMPENSSQFGGRQFYAGKPEMGLSEVEYVVIDEADVLFDKDFREATRLLLSDISAARGHPLPPSTTTAPQHTNYPFHLILTSATIPWSLANHLDTHHPNLTRLVSPNLHRLPQTLRTEHVGWTGGNRDADVVKRIKRVWAEDALRGPDAHGRRQKSKILVFCNKSTRVDALSAYLKEHGVDNVALSGTSGERRHGSNHHLDGFLNSSRERIPAASPGSTQIVLSSGEKKRVEEPHVLITTSLLSRGLDFAPSVRHVFVVDSPRNMIDFLHRAGRSGRAGNQGKVVVFGKLRGRGSSVAKDVRRKVGALVM
ncbi:P-loop containing nucleoside triphosphate hydrolase protein [Rickenella mellea]|uniref:RNA helicase n=1 Tax=Rickenella mellea TaxID=50990 RepID=A0A4Y7Q5H4_9AGAM|nr:P-loop containing nucleoside triphosphate hydrolase protein [Rickenella mellea]